MKLVNPSSRDIFRSQAQVLVCPVNTVGTMGNGLAAAFKNKYAGLFEVYELRVRNGYLSTRALNPSNFVNIGNGQHVLLFPTKAHWLDDSRLDYIQDGMAGLDEAMKSLGLTSIAFPMIGCGKGKLDWETQVRPVVIQYLSVTDLEVELYEHARTR